MKTKSLVLILAVFMSMLGVKALAHDEVYEYDGVYIYYNWLDDNHNKLVVTYPKNTDIVTYKKYTGNVVIPEIVKVGYPAKSYPVVGISEDAFKGCSDLTSVTIPNSVTSIGDYAFRGCSDLTSVTIPNSVTSIGYGAFYGCSGLTSVTIGNRVEFINTNAFCGCSSLEEVNYNATNCSEFGSWVFRNCPSIITLNLGDDVRIIPWRLFSDCKGLTTINIGNSVTSIGYGAFKGRYSLTSVTIGNSVTSIEAEAFSDCSNLTSVTIGNSVTSIGGDAFSGCSRLQKVIVQDIAAWFNISFGVNSNPLTIAKHLYKNENTEIKELIIPNSVTSIRDDAFCGCSGLTSLTIPNSVTSIGDDAFRGCSGLTSLTIPNSVTSIGDDAFCGCSGLTSLTIPNSVTSIGKETFSGCSGLTSVTIPYSVTSIGNNAFRGCSGLTLLSIPNSVTSIEKYAFYGCNKLETIKVETGNPEYDSRDDCNAIIETSSNTLIFGCKNSFIPNSVTSIGDIAFSNCSGLTSVTIPNSVISIGDYAFSDCRGLTSVTIPNSVTSIGDDAFRGCSGLTSVTIPNSVTTIESGAFSSCLGLTSVTIPNSVTSIGEKAFSGCKNLTSVTMPNSVTSIGKETFSGCSGLTSMTIGSSVTSIGDSAFKGCSRLSSVSIPNSVTSIGEKAFYCCDGLKSITIGNSVTDIKKEAFQGCKGLDSVSIGNSVNFMGSGAFKGCSIRILNVKDIAAWCNINFADQDSNPLAYAQYFCLNGEIIRDLIIPNGVTTIERWAFYSFNGLTSVTIPRSVTTIENWAFYDCSGLISVKLENENPASVDLGNFNHLNIIIYVPKGSKTEYQSASFWNRYNRIVEYPNSDVNQDGESNVVDVVDIARFVVGTPRDTFVDVLADLNSDDEVNVADAVALVNEIAGDQNFAKAFGSPQQMGDDRLTLTENADHSLAFAMESLRGYTAFQFDLYTNSDVDVMNLRLNAARKNGHQLMYNKVDEGHYRVAVLSTDNNVFNGNNGELLNIQFDGFNTSAVAVCCIHFITADGTDHRFDDLAVQGETTGISLTPNPPVAVEENIYDLSGRRIPESSELPKRVYIVNGKKVIVK